MRSAPERLEGYRLALRLVVPEDADYIHGLRIDPAYNRHLSPVSGTVSDQRAWLQVYKEREARGLEYYYVAQRLDDGRSCGLVRLYDLSEDHFTWGSWILDHNKPSKAALESAVLSFEVGFEHLGLTQALIDVRHGNERAIAFYRRFGMREIRTDQQNLYFEYPQERFASDKAEHTDVLKRGSD